MEYGADAGAARADSRRAGAAGLLRATATIGSLTLSSRVFGLIRDILTARYLGAGLVTDAFFVALRLPNLFRSLFAEGAFSAAFVPLFTGTMAAEGQPAARRYAEDALSVLLSALLVFVVLGEALMPMLLTIIAPGFGNDPEKFALAVELTRITFPYLLFIALVALQGGILNALDRFAAAAGTPILLNLFMIAALVSLPRLGRHGGEALAWSVTAAGLAQFLWLLYSCAQAGIALRLPLPRLTPQIRRTLQVMGPGVLGAGVTQVNLLISTALASLLPGGSVSYLYYADRLNQLPLGVVGIAVGTAILPSLSRQLRLGDPAGASATQNRGLELALLLTMPAAVGLILLAGPIVTVLLARGRFDATAAAATAAALAAYAAGLPAFVLVKVLAPGFFARHDTATPVKIGAASMALNLVLTVALMQPLAHVGIALATSAAGWLNALLLFFVLRRRGDFRLDARSRRNLPRLLLATLGMGALVLGLRLVLAPALGGSAVPRLSALAALIAAGLASFAALALGLGIARWRDLKPWRPA